MLPVPIVMTDQELLHAFLHYRPKRQRAFTTLVTRHVHWMHAAATRQVGDPHTAEDVVQAAFIVLAKKAASLPDDVRLTSWLAGVIRLSAKRRRRDLARQRRHETQLCMKIVPRDAPSAADEAVWNEIAPQLDAAVNRLRKIDREAILLRFYRQCSYAEIGAALEISEEAAKKRVGRALEKLRPMLAKQGGLAGIGVASLALLLATYTTADAAPAGLIGTSITIGLSGAMRGLLVGCSGPTASGVMAAIHCTQLKIIAGVALLLGVIGVAAIQVATLAHNVPSSSLGPHPIAVPDEPAASHQLTSPTSPLYYAARNSAGS